MVGAFLSSRVCCKLCERSHRARTSLVWKLKNQLGGYLRVLGMEMSGLLSSLLQVSASSCVFIILPMIEVRFVCGSQDEETYQHPGTFENLWQTLRKK